MPVDVDVLVVGAGISGIGAGYHLQTRCPDRSYAILEAPFPVTGYLSTLRVTEAEGGKASRVDWSGEFTPNGVSDAEASSLFQGIYEAGLKALAAKLAR